MGWLSQNKYRLSGTLTGSLILDETNSESGTFSSLGWNTYSDYNYSATTYARTSFYEGVYDAGDARGKVVRFNALGDICYQYATSSDNLTYSAWTPEQTVSSSNGERITTRYFKLRLIYDSDLWTDSDYVGSLTVEDYFRIFEKNTIVDADEKMSNFYYCGDGDLLPKGGTELNKTSGVYDLGSSDYVWDNIHCNNIWTQNLGTVSANNLWQLSSEVNLNSATTRIEFEVSSTSNDMYFVFGYMIFATNATSRVGLHLNGDSATNYYDKYFEDTVSALINRKAQIFGIHTGFTNTVYRTMSYCYIQNHETTIKPIQTVFCDGFVGSTLQRTFKDVALWNNTANNITSIVFKTTEGNYSETASLELQSGSYFALYKRRGA